MQKTNECLGQKKESKSANPKTQQKPTGSDDPLAGAWVKVQVWYNKRTLTHAKRTVLNIMPKPPNPFHPHFSYFPFSLFNHIRYRFSLMFIKAFKP